MRIGVRALSALLALTLLLSFPAAVAEGVYYGSKPPEDLYLVQSQRHTCTLIAATMMLRNYAREQGSPYQFVTDTGVRRYAWSDRGLSQHFTIGCVEVSCSTEIREASDRNQYLIQCLQAHPEGVVIYDTGTPHAILLLGYEEDTDTFYCADTTSRNGGCSIPLEESIIHGRTQQDKIDTIDKIWYVVS